MCPWQILRLCRLAFTSAIAGFVPCLPAPAHAQSCQPHWESLGSGLNSYPMMLLQFDEDGDGGNPPALFAGGSLAMAGGQPVDLVARWDGRNWSAVGSNFAPFSGINSLASFDQDGDGPNPPQLHAGGVLKLDGSSEWVDVLHWDGVTWSVTGDGLGIKGPDDYVNVLAPFDDDGPGPHPPALYAGGYFSVAPNGHYIARWEGANWLWPTDGTGGEVRALTVFDEDADGPNLPGLFVAGLFTTAGDITVRSIARFDGKGFTAVGGGVKIGSNSGYVTAMTLFDDDGDGPNHPALIVGGHFDTAGGVAASCVAKWDGQAWSPLGAGIGVFAFGKYELVHALAQFDEDGSGPNPPRLFAAGTFTFAGGQSITNLARWDGTSWSEVGGGVNDSPGLGALAVFDPDGAGGQPGALIIGGLVTLAGDVPVSNIAAWVSCTPTPGDATGEGAVNIDDLLAVISAWGPCPAPCAPSATNCPADLAPQAGDCTVNIDDLLAVIGNWDQ
jgi:trimeric autotransporter adhesin